MQQAFVYILASRPNGTLYVGVTGDLRQRIHQHRMGDVPGFTKRYGIKQLVHFEPRNTMPDAILREKRIKKWRRAWKIHLIEEHNPQWQDLFDQLNG